MNKRLRVETQDVNDAAGYDSRQRGRSVRCLKDLAHRVAIVAEVQVERAIDRSSSRADAQGEVVCGETYMPETDLVETRASLGDRRFGGSERRCKHGWRDEVSKRRQPRARDRECSSRERSGISWLHHDVEVDTRSRRHVAHEFRRCWKRP